MPNSSFHRTLIITWSAWISFSDIGLRHVPESPIQRLRILLINLTFRHYHHWWWKGYGNERFEKDVFVTNTGVCNLLSTIFPITMSPKWYFEGWGFFVRSSLVGKQRFFLVRGPFSSNAFGTGIPTYRIRQKNHEPMQKRPGNVIHLK